MGKLSIQFHALPEELLQFATDCMRDFGLHVTAMRFPPMELFSADGLRLDEVFQDKLVSQFLFTTTPGTLPVATQVEFHERHPDALLLDIGRLTDKGLEESWLATMASDFPTWKKIATRLKKMTKAGAVATNPETGAWVVARNHRYTMGAKTLQEKGVTMLPVAGSSIFTFPK